MPSVPSPRAARSPRRPLCPHCGNDVLPTKINAAEIKRLYVVEQLTVREIGTRIGAHYSNVSRALAAQGVTAATKRAHRLAKGGVA